MHEKIKRMQTDLKILKMEIDNNTTGKGREFQKWKVARTAYYKDTPPPEAYITKPGMEQDTVIESRFIGEIIWILSRFGNKTFSEFLTPENKITFYEQMAQTVIQFHSRGENQTAQNLFICLWNCANEIAKEFSDPLNH